MITVACVKWGSMYGPEYVNRLYAMVARNLTDGTKGRFVCFTDDAEGLWPQVEIRPLPEGMTGWWNKLYLFAPGTFEDGERVVYFDLDTLIIGPIDDIMAYDGEFAILRDFYRPQGWGSGVMAWRGGFGAGIWESWARSGRPDMVGGDQAWIEMCLYGNGALKIDLWQALFPGAFCSYKADCRPFPPAAARIVCFHGEPKPHDCGRAWVRDIWQEGDAGVFHLKMDRNTPLDIVRAQSRSSGARGLPGVGQDKAHGREVVVIGGGPSLADNLDDIRWRAGQGHDVWALNGAYDWLRSHDIKCHALVILDARQDNAKFVAGASTETTYTTFYIASQCHPDVYDLLANHRVVRFDLDTFGDAGTTVGTHALCLAFLKGFRRFHLYGFDSSYRDGHGHAYVQPMNDGENIIDVHCGDRVFKAAPWMMQQAKDFQSLARDMMAADSTTEIIVHGDGLLPYLARLMAHPELIAA